MRSVKDSGEQHACRPCTWQSDVKLLIELTPAQLKEIRTAQLEVILRSDAKLDIDNELLGR